MEQWLKDSLSDILQFDVPEDMINYILSINNLNELTDHMKTLIDFSNSQHKNFFLELSKKRFSAQGQNAQSKQQKKKNAKNKSQQKQQENITIIVEKQISESPETDKNTSNSKKKTKFVNLYSQEGKNAQVITLKGRHHCDCQASKHELINNCMKCGRIVCRQEGSGPCLFCGNLVCTPQEQRELNAKTKASAKLMQSLMDQSRPKGWEAAVSHRNRLLEYDRTSERRTRVTDDDSDYFNANSVWLSSNEKEKLNKYQQSLHDKKHQSRLHKKMTFDFAGRQVVEDNTIEHDVNTEKIQEILGEGARNTAMMPTDWFIGDGGDRDVAPGVNAPLLQFDESIESMYTPVPRPVRAMTSSRIQDAQIQEMTDTGKCMSMHQPWASLLVDGIKLHEGRTWYTSHRGRLWIASTVKPPDPEVVRALEHQYTVLYPDKNFKFPSFYPTGCLLGCVNVDDCLPQEEYDKVYPEGESDSPYVFICSNPVSLKLRFPVKGQHKIYQLDKTIHQAAVKCIQKMAKIQADEANAG